MSRVVLHRLVRLTAARPLSAHHGQHLDDLSRQRGSRKARETKLRTRYTRYRPTYPPIPPEQISRVAGIYEALSTASAVALKTTSAIPQMSSHEALTSACALHQRRGSAHYT